MGNKDVDNIYAETAEARLQNGLRILASIIAREILKKQSATKKADKTLHKE